MPFIYRWIAGLLIVLVGAGAAYIYGRKGGYEKRDLMCRAEVSALEMRAIEAERQGHALREKSRALADKLAAEAAEAKAKIATLQGRLDHEVAQLSRARRVFDERIVRLLNDLSPIRESGGDSAGAAAAGTAASTPAAAADRPGSSGRGASVHSVATALSQCRGGYEACRVQLHSLIDHWEAISR